MSPQSCFVKMSYFAIDFQTEMPYLLSPPQGWEVFLRSLKIRQQLLALSHWLLATICDPLLIECVGNDGDDHGIRGIQKICDPSANFGTSWDTLGRNGMNMGGRAGVLAENAGRGP
jgi:hypothetical protein